MNNIIHLIKVVLKHSIHLYHNNHNSCYNWRKSFNHLRLTYGLMPSLFDLLIQLSFTLYYLFECFTSSGKCAQHPLHPPASCSPFPSFLSLPSKSPVNYSRDDHFWHNEGDMSACMQPSTALETGMKRERQRQMFAMHKGGGEDSETEQGVESWGDCG